MVMEVGVIVRNSAGKRLMSILKVLIPLGLFIIIVIELKNEITHIDISLLKKHLVNLTGVHILAIILLGLVAITPMIFYDFVLVRILGYSIPRSKVTAFSWAANTYSNFVGFGGVAGLGLRVFFYQKYSLAKAAITKSIAKVSVFYISGLSVLSWTVAFGVTRSRFLSDIRWLELAVWGIALYVPLLLLTFVIRGRVKGEGGYSYRFIFDLVIISLVEWLAAMSLFWFIAYIMHLPVTFAHLYPIFILAACAGIISMIPGGLGSFDLVMLLGLEYYQVPSESAIVLLLLYRISYYLIPFLIGTVFLGKEMWNRLLDKYTIIHIPKNGKRDREEGQKQEFRLTQAEDQ